MSSSDPFNLIGLVAN